MTNFRPIIRMLLWAGLAGAAGYTVALFLPKTYSSSMSLYFPGSQSKPATGGLAALTGAGVSEPDSGTISNLRGSFVSPLVGSGAQTATGILTSKTCLLEVIDKLGLTKVWNLGRWAAYNRLQSSVSVRTEKTGFLKIEANVNDPKLCKDIVQKMREHLDRRSAELTVNVSSRNRKEVEAQYAKASEQVTQIRQKLIAASGTYDSLLSQNIGKIVVDAQARYDEAQVTLKSGKTRLAATRTMISQVLDPKARYPMNLAALNVIAGNAQEANAALNASLGILATQLQERRLALADAAKRFQPNSPEYREIKRRADAAESMVSEVIASQGANGKTSRPDLMAAEAEVQALEELASGYRGLLDRYKDISRGAPAKITEVEALRAEFQNALTQRGTLESEVAFARLAEIRDPARYEVVDAPMEEPSPIAPRKGMIAVLVAVVALALQIAPRVVKLPDLSTPNQRES